MSNRLQLALTHALEAMARLESNLVDKLGSGDHIEIVKAALANTTAELNAAASESPAETAPETANQPASTGTDPTTGTAASTDQAASSTSAADPAAGTAGTAS